jgi:hypothetical protein
LPYGIGRLLVGTVFSVGRLLVVIGGAELFTGNNIIVMAWASGKVATRALLLNWVIAFVGNFAGALCTAALMFTTTQYTFGDGAVGLAALSTAHAKTSLAFVPALTLGIMCVMRSCVLRSGYALVRGRLWIAFFRSYYQSRRSLLPALSTALRMPISFLWACLSKLGRRIRFGGP